MAPFNYAGIALLVAVAGIGAAVVFAAGNRKVAALRARGIYPEAGKETEGDVLRLLQTGERIMAIRCYRGLHKVGLKEAKAAVELRERKES